MHEHLCTHHSCDFIGIKISTKRHSIKSLWPVENNEIKCNIIQPENDSLSSICVSVFTNQNVYLQMLNDIFILVLTDIIYFDIVFTSVSQNALQKSTNITIFE